MECMAIAASTTAAASPPRRYLCEVSADTVQPSIAGYMDYAVFQKISEPLIKMNVQMLLDHTQHTREVEQPWRVGSHLSCWGGKIAFDRSAWVDIL